MLSAQENRTFVNCFSLADIKDVGHEKHQGVVQGAGMLLKDGHNIEDDFMFQNQKQEFGEGKFILF